MSFREGSRAETVWPQGRGSGQRGCASGARQRGRQGKAEAANAAAAEAIVDYIHAQSLDAKAARRALRWRGVHRHVCMALRRIRRPSEKSCSCCGNVAGVAQVNDKDGSRRSRAGSAMARSGERRQPLQDRQEVLWRRQQVPGDFRSQQADAHAPGQDLSRQMLRIPLPANRPKNDSRKRPLAGRFSWQHGKVTPTAIDMQFLLPALRRSSNRRRVHKPFAPGHAYTGGEPLRPISLPAGCRPSPAAPCSKSAHGFARTFDSIRTVLMWEPRGQYVDMYGAVVTPSSETRGAFDVFSCTTRAGKHMCGHAILCVDQVCCGGGLGGTGIGREGARRFTFPPVASTRRHFAKTGWCSSVFRNVPSFVLRRNAVVDVPGPAP